ncbi:hydrolase [Pseudonocardia sulfidoxydans NBRC 16205]|uniref:Hydrolase n=1 Tax=Pseudonocardia sulfidoxydans NBRC 16205 TaxID=1223511 RepID=A0A511DHJ2_9PSEU|nr:isochorismatase family cysteine hydrolase [Pseudonocardia sulfidoxydans]GEL23833.1 hydrolase [Pseudonocardia sulfidoxydans NBRC 16205]
MPEINPVLVVVDVQNGFVTEHSRHVVPIVARLAQDWLDNGRDVVFTRYLNYDGSPFERVMGWSKLKDSPEIDIVDELQDLSRKATAVIDKTIYTLFNDEGSALAESLQWTDMFVCGIDTEVCVLKTAVDAFEHGIRSWLLTDASASHSGRLAHDAGVQVAEKMLGRLQTISTVDVEGCLSST